MQNFPEPEKDQGVSIPAGEIALEGNLNIPKNACGLVLFAHGSGSSRHSVRNQFVADFLNRNHLGTLLFDLLSAEEEAIDLRTTQLRFDIAFLAERLLHAVNWAGKNPAIGQLNLGCFGSSTGGGAALLAAAEEKKIAAIVSRGGRPDLAGNALGFVQAPTLLIVGGNDFQVIELNRQALAQMHCEKKLEIIPGATHLFEEPGALEEVADLASQWFQRHLAPA
ncbi:MAG: dienelactone hydrolase family protein [Verrucomicrobiota bacterium]|nr:dienelactone hydrolase family protein [Verrucomicrobiota bacterium]